MTVDTVAAQTSLVKNAQRAIGRGCVIDVASHAMRKLHYDACAGEKRRDATRRLSVDRLLRPDDSRDPISSDHQPTEIPRSQKDSKTDQTADCYLESLATFIHPR